jgi:hypothetical protein
MSYFAHHPIIEPDLSEYPVIHQTSPATGLSDRYRQVPTIDVINHVREKGYKVTGILASRAHTSSGAYGRHLVRMRQEFGGRQAGDCLPELVIDNSHNGVSRCQITLGLLRVACANGLITGSSADFSFTLTHVGDVRNQVIQIVDKTSERIGEIEQNIRTWNNRKLSDAEMFEFAGRAKLLRWGADDPKIQAIPTADILQAQRAEDTGNSLWKVYNRTQENLMRGGVGYSQAPAGRVRRSYRRTKPLAAPARVLQFNQALWDLAHEFAN